MTIQLNDAPNRTFTQNVQIELNKKYFLLEKDKQCAIKYDNKKFVFIFNALSLIYNAKRRFMHIWQSNYKKKLNLQNKKKNGLKEKKISNKWTNILLWYKQIKKRRHIVKKQWYYNKDAYLKKMKLKSYQTNFITFYQRKNINKIFLMSKVFLKKKNYFKKANKQTIIR